jgi:estrogen-related receptor beta like 1
MPTGNPNQQFYYFTSLVAWLLTVCGHPFTAPGQFDAPNATISKICMRDDRGVLHEPKLV